MYKINICHLYADLLNLYGDRGNIIAIQKRCEWNGIDVDIDHISIGDHLDAGKYDLIFIGGGQDYEQELVRNDLLSQKAAEVKNYIENDGILLAICGGYQLLGRYYQTSEGKTLKFLGALDFVTIAGKKRMTGDIIFQCDFLEPGMNNRILVGFENHIGKSFLGDDVKPLGKVIKGHGNNGEDNSEGLIYKNTYCSYSHGSLLPKNPIFTDYLISKIISNKYENFKMKQIGNDTLEILAHNAILHRLYKIPHKE